MAWVQLHCLVTQCRTSTIMFEGGEWSPAGYLFISINTSNVRKGLEAVVTICRIMGPEPGSCRSSRHPKPLESIDGEALAAGRERALRGRHLARPLGPRDPRQSTTIG
jgi:hypothetical protein